MAALLRAGRGVRILEGQNGRRSIFHVRSGFYYHQNLVSEDGTKYYRCIKYGTLQCRGRAIWTPTPDGGGTHNHLPDPLFAGRVTCRRSILARCRSGETTPPWMILQEERDRFPRAIAATMTMRRMRSAMNYARNSVRPPIPQSPQELGEVLADPAYRFLTVTADGGASVFSCSVTATDGTVSVIFASPRQLNFMTRAAVIFADGTFCTPTVPNASQVFNLCTTWRWPILPLAIVLMERRTVPAYRAVVQKLKEINPNLDPDVIMCDFESAQLRIWREEFPNAEWEGCLYYFMAFCTAPVQ